MDVSGNPLKGLLITDNVLVETRLPLKFKSQAMGVFSNGRFVRADDGRYGILADVLKSLLADGFGWR